MKFFGVEVSLTEIEQIYDDINRFFNKEAEQRCMGLKIANENIEQWYNEVVAYLKDFVEGNVSYGQFFNFTHKRERVPVSERSTFFLGSSWFNNYKPGILKRPIDLHELSEPIRENIYNYKEKAVGRKVQWLEEAKEEDIMNVPREKVNQWVKDLDRLRKDVNKSVSDLEHEISCQKISYRKIFQNTINKIRERDKTVHNVQLSKSNNLLS